MKKIILFISFAVILSSCNAQTKKEKEIATNKEKPKGNYKVNKEYDENGNLIKYDSIYTYYYSNVDKEEMRNDSVFKKINEHLKGIDPLNNDSFFKEFFNQENLNEDDFFSEDFFSGNLNNNQEMMQKMMKRMDSLKNEFLIKEFPLEENKRKKKDD
ncbi:MAG TPA: hypothetical protein DDZ39_05925 [Flavobacteriaceae bacterium]|jgi:hypothetical protein|nr:hypothetical protein [Flavobacteriaceae bacterium]HBS13198.1 hypothetical protein [Flavobacteriaceae bacterium]